MQAVVVIAGPANSGKMPLARKLLAENAYLVLVHRDHLRTSFEAQVDEWDITLLMAALARGILKIGRSPLIVAWNLEHADRKLWTEIALHFDVDLIWHDTRDPNVAAMIPPMGDAQMAAE